YRFARSRARRSLPLPLTVHLRSAAIDSSSGFRWLQNPGRIFTSALRRATERTSAVAALVGATDNARHGPRFRLARTRRNAVSCRPWRPGVLSSAGLRSTCSILPAAWDSVLGSPLGRSLYSRPQAGELGGVG